MSEATAQAPTNTNPDAESGAEVHREPLNVYQMIGEVTRRLALVGISKSQQNEQQKYMFRGIDDVYNALAPMLPEIGLVIMPNAKTPDLQTRAGKNNSTIVHVRLDVEYTFISCDDGSTHTVTMPGEAMDYSDKATNKALSAAYKYLCFQTFCIPLEGTDGDGITPELGKHNATGRKPESAAKTTSREHGEMSAEERDALASINMSVFNDDPHGFYEVWDELDNDGKARVWGQLERDERKQCKVWQDDRKES